MIVIATLLQNFQVVEGLVKLLSKKLYFRTPFESQHVRGSQSRVKSASENFHRIFHHSERP